MENSKINRCNRVDYSLLGFDFINYFRVDFEVGKFKNNLPNNRLFPSFFRKLFPMKSTYMLFILITIYSNFTLQLNMTFYEDIQIYMREGWFYSVIGCYVFVSPSGGRYRNWRRRWFILKSNCLYYFEFTTVSFKNEYFFNYEYFPFFSFLTIFSRCENIVYLSNAKMYLFICQSYLGTPSPQWSQSYRA